jgi:beta-galactosidase
VNFNDSKWKPFRHDWAIYGPFDVDKQSVAIVQNGENIATEKTEEDGAPHI